MAREAGFFWTITGCYVKPKTARDVMNILGAIGVYSAGQRFAWRGMSSVDYHLTSSLQRKLGWGATEAVMREAEVELLTAAREWGLGVGPGGHVDDLQLLADLQHYGIATRLVDFTSNPMTALWFACQPPAAGVAKTGVLLALNTTGWKRLSTVAPPGSLTRDAVGDPTGSRLRLELAKPAPFVVESPIPNDRLRAQEGFFIAGAVPPDTSQAVEHGRIFTIDPFEAFAVPWQRGNPDELAARLGANRQRGHPTALPFVAVIINAGLKAKLLRYLEDTYNRTARVLFPDYAGFLEFRSEAATRQSVAS